MSVRTGPPWFGSTGRTTKGPPSGSPSYPPFPLVIGAAGYDLGRGVDAMEDTELGRLLRRHRAAAGLTQEELAERAGISSRTISDVERGLRDGVFRDTAARLAVALGIAGDERTRFEAVARGRRGRPGESAPAAWKPAAPPPAPKHCGAPAGWPTTKATTATPRPAPRRC